MSVITDRRRCTGVTITGYVIIVIAAVAIDPTMHAMACPINLPPPPFVSEETGTVKWFNVERGFGFIARDSGGKDVFVHISALAPSGLTALNEGERVTFDVVDGRKGPEAARVRLV
jgi:CspA family cold shock protein